MNTALKRMISTKYLMFDRRKSGNIYLTFDDGPHPEHTERILSVLRAYEIKATFFPLGSLVARYPALVSRMAEEGHMVGSHLFSHRSVKRLTPQEWGEEVDRTQDVLQSILGKKIVYVRPPYGDVTLKFAWAVIRKGMRMVLWSVDSADSFVRESGALTARMRDEDVRSGDIILFHEDYPHTVEALPAIVDYWIRAGHKPACL